MTISDVYFDKIITMVTERTGIIPRESHKTGIKNFVENKIETIDSDDKLSRYMFLLTTDTGTFTELINQSTVNETYFFREEKQFKYLQSNIFAQWPYTRGSEPINIWSAACSTGEEAYSLSLLAKACHVKVNIIASDINEAVLEKCKNGVFKESSIRKGDGEDFHFLLKPYIQEDRSIKITGEIQDCIKTRNINLNSITDFATSLTLPKQQNIIFIRNVFIYFNFESRAKILKVLADNCMADNGVLFVSMNEIASLDSSIIPKNLEKVVEGNVFFLHKKS